MVVNHHYQHQMIIHYVRVLWIQRDIQCLSLGQKSNKNNNMARIKLIYSSHNKSYNNKRSYSNISCGITKLS